MSYSEGILVISDMHITDDIYGRGAGQCMFNKDISFENNFRRSIITEIEENKIQLNYILVLGDSSDFALGSEFKKASEILNGLCDRLNIKKENVLIIPGNHDMSREKLRYQCYESGIKKDEIINNQHLKFEDFTKFYNDFYSNKDIEFDPQRAIVRVLYAENMDIVFVGVNSIYKDSFRNEDHCGYINYRALDSELEEVRRSYPNSIIIALMHHTPQPIAGEKNTITNWNDVIGLFDREKVFTFISGHAHTNDGLSAQTKNVRNYLTSGSLSASDVGVRSSYMLLKYVDTDDKKRLQVFPYNYENDYNPANKYWQLQGRKENIVDYIDLK